MQVAHALLIILFVSIASCKTVAIIGSGVSGLVSAKSALEQNLEPTLFEKENELGGMWNPKAQSVYDSMKTNLSKYTCVFSDYIWNKNASLYPTQQEVFYFLNDYANHFKIKMKNNAKVTAVFPSNGKWNVTWQTGQDFRSRIFDFVVIATGFFNTPFTPPIAGLDKFKGQALHSSKYRNPTPFANKKIVVVGASYSAVEIAAEVATVSDQVTNVITKEFWVIPRNIPSSSAVAPAFLPLDFVFYRYNSHPFDEERVFRTPEENKGMNDYFRNMVGNYTFTPPVGSMEPAFVSISDTYAQRVHSGKVSIAKGRVVQVTEDKVILNSGVTLDGVEVLILCTGFKPELPFFSKSILEILEYNPNDTFDPILLHKNVFHPKLPGLAFVGMYRGPYFGVMELQARWATQVFARTVPAPTVEEQLAGIALEAKIRDQKPRPAFPHPDYIGLSNSYALLIDSLRSQEWRKQDQVVIPAQYRESNISDLAVQAVDRVNVAYLNGTMMNYAIFRALRGEWSLFKPTERTIGNATFIDSNSSTTYCYYDTESPQRLIFALVEDNKIAIFEASETCARGKTFITLHVAKEKDKWVAAGIRNNQFIKYSFVFTGCTIKTMDIQINSSTVAEYTRK